MNVLDLYSTAQANEQAAIDVGKLDTTAPQVDPFRPEVSERLGGSRIAEAATHTFQVVLFLAAALFILGHLQGEIRWNEVAKVE